MAYEGFEDKTHYIFAVCLLPSDEFIGGESKRRFNRAELGFWIAEPFWGNGYATEAAHEVLTFGFEKAGIHKILGQHMVSNPASGKVMSKTEW